MAAHIAVIKTADEWRWTYGHESHTPLSDGPHKKNTERRRLLKLLETGDLLGVPVGVIVETRDGEP